MNAKEFFDVKGKFPIAFTIWRYRAKKSQKSKSSSVPLIDLTWMKKSDLKNINWDDQKETNEKCKKILNSSDSALVAFGIPRQNIKVWSEQTRKDIQREKRKLEALSAPCGLPLGDPRHDRKKRLGEMDGKYIAFADDLTPIRVNLDTKNVPWFRLNNQFMDCRKTRCFSGPPTHVGYCASDLETSKKLFIWFALGRTFASESYPMWVDAMELWAPVVTPDLISISFAIGYAENEAIHSVFPANNPVKGAAELIAYNPMTRLRTDSFWNKTMRPTLKGEFAGKDLVAAVDRIYDLWKKEIESKNQEIKVTYERPYFIGKSSLNIGAGLVQIWDYANELNKKELITAFEEMKKVLSETKKRLKTMLMDADQLNYFGAQPTLPGLNEEASAVASKLKKARESINQKNKKPSDKTLKKEKTNLRK